MTTTDLPPELSGLTAAGCGTTWRSRERGEQILVAHRPITRVVGAEIHAEVRGSHEGTYRVRLYYQPYKTVPRGYIAAHCTCPVGGGSSWCKHAVAVGLAHLGWDPPPPPEPEPWWARDPVTLESLMAELPNQAASVSGWGFVNDPVGGGAALLEAAVTAGTLPGPLAISAACRLAWPPDAHRSHRGMEDVGAALASAVADVHRASLVNASWGDLADVAEATGVAAIYLAEHTDTSYGGAGMTMWLATHALLAAARTAPKDVAPRIAAVATNLRRPSGWSLESEAERVLSDPNELDGIHPSLLAALDAR